MAMVVMILGLTDQGLFAAPSSIWAFWAGLAGYHPRDLDVSFVLGAMGHMLRASQILQDEVLKHPRFTVHLNTEIVSLKGRHKLEEVVARDRATGTENHWQPAGAVVFIGQHPNTDLVRGTVELDRWGFIVTDANYQTSLPGVFAAGDARQGSTKQLGSAAGEGIAAILQVRGYLQKLRQLAAVAVND